MNRTKQIKFIQKAYKQRIKGLQKGLFTDSYAGIQLFVEYLKYMRDFIILNLNNENEQQMGESRLSLTTLILAITEFDTYNQNNENTEETQRNLHWENFCELLKENFEEWLILYDSI